ncbi:DUF4307 domain-containing protein [Herbiconiux sp. L3-i23]|uniref:DUF4307 domain-containing protein n=1 Tax=Herbiconiux sp. L3-i23 TaxID=2905871 RepID=UPI0020612C95|nr:DUF4307 domain-containing protein [Herbiconiux sp. L3-i23]BDI23571.1 hypothetical protein L3i23_23470 [Herbiconiux sp. L3-i23]
MTTSSGSTLPAPDLDERYGRTPDSRRRGRLIAWGAGIAVALVFLAWVVWAGLDGTAPKLEVRDTGYQLTESTATARFQVTVDPGTAVRCAVQALNEQFEIVGWKVVDLPPSDERTRGFVETVRTTMQPNTGLIYRCWLP